MLKSEQNVPEDAVDGAKNISLEDLSSRLEAVLLSKYIANNRIALVILALKDILEKDDMSDDTYLSKYKKRELIDLVNVNAAEFIACVLIYSCTEVKNRNYKDGKTDFITTDYVDSFEASRNLITERRLRNYPVEKRTRQRSRQKKNVRGSLSRVISMYLQNLMEQFSLHSLKRRQSMTVKEYLGQAYLLDKRIKSDTMELEELRLMSQTISSPGFEEHYNASKNTDTLKGILLIILQMS